MQKDSQWKKGTPSLPGWWIPGVGLAKAGGGAVPSPEQEGVGPTRD